MSKHTQKRSHHRPKVIVADSSGSSAISDLRWRDGVAYFTFARDGYSDSVEMSKSDFKEWADSGSLGGWYNENLG